jgi:3-deoxy-manno-octulosonate cytidylyltransferase (CMP-KDO synthetase)
LSTLVVIPARLGSTRLQRKPLRLLAGEPIVVRVWKRVSGLGIADDCVVATDSDEVRDACTSVGATVVMTALEHPSGTDRVAEVAAQEPFRYHDVVLNVQGDEPFMSERAKRATVGMVSSGDLEIATAAVPLDESELEHPDIVKVVLADDGSAQLFSRAPIPFLRAPVDRGLRESLLRRHIGIYAYTPAALRSWVSLTEHPLEKVERLEQLRPLLAGMKIGVAVIPERTLPGIDTESDLAFANEHWNAFNSQPRNAELLK